MFWIEREQRARAKLWSFIGGQDFTRHCTGLNMGEYPKENEIGKIYINIIEHFIIHFYYRFDLISGIVLG